MQVCSAKLELDPCNKQFSTRSRMVGFYDVEQKGQLMVLTRILNVTYGKMTDQRNMEWDMYKTSATHSSARRPRSTPERFPPQLKIVRLIKDSLANETQFWLCWI